jgi:hypothetical protein
MSYSGARYPFPLRGLGQINDSRAWVERNGARLSHALADPMIRAELLALIGGEYQERRRRRRLEEIGCDLAEMEVRWRIGDGVADP